MSGQCNGQHRAVFPGDECGVRAARAWLAGYIEGHPRRDDIALTAAELAGNAIRHTASGGDLFALSVEHEEAGTRLTVEDGGSDDSKPEVCLVGGDPAEGHGLLLVDALTDAWGHADSLYGGRDVWAWWDE